MKKTLALLTATILLLSMLFVAPTLAASEGDSDGTITVTSATPAISSVELWNEAEDTDKNNTALTVNLEYHLNFTVSDSNTMADLHNVTIWMWNSGGGTSKGDSNAERNHYTYTWTESTDTWASSPSGFHDAADCKDPGTGGSETSYEFTLAYDLSKVGNYSNGGAPYDGWSINITAYDDSANEGSDTTGQFGIASYLDLTVTDSTHTFSGAPNSNDNAVSAGGDAKIDVSIITNYEFDVQVKSMNATVNSTGTPTDYFNIGNITHYGSDVAGSSVALTTSYVDVTGLTNQTPPTAEASPVTPGVYLWLDVPDGQAAHTDYTYTLRIQIIRYTG